MSSKIGMSQLTRLVVSPCTLFLVFKNAMPEVEIYSLARFRAPRDPLIHE